MIEYYPYFLRSLTKVKFFLPTSSVVNSFKPCHHTHFIWKTFSSSHNLRRSVPKELNRNQVVQKRSSITQELKRLLGLAKPEKWKLSGAVCLLLVSSAVTMAVPFCIGKIIDTMYTTDVEERKAQLRYMCSFFLVAFVVGAVANFGRVYLIQTSGQRIVARLRGDLFASILNQEISFFDKNKTGELINRLSSDTLLVGQSVTQNISDGLRSITGVVACISMMIYTSPKLAFVGFCVVPPVALIAIFYGRFVRNITREVQDGFAGVSQISEERMSNIRTVRAFAQEHREKALYVSKLVEVLQLQYREALAKAFFYGSAGFSGNMIVMIVLYYGGTMMTEAQLTVGDLSAFLMYAGYMGLSLGGFSSFYSELMKGIGASNKLWYLLDRLPAIPISGGLIPEVGKGEIAFRNVHFAYPIRPDAKIFRGLDMLVPAGSVTAVVGSSGSGKSTIAALLLRFYDPQEGSILLDGLNMNTLDPEWVRNQVGLVSQEPILFSGSIRDNITYGMRQAKSSISDAEIMTACMQANAYDFVQAFPDKLDTIVGQLGQLLSGGQRQRIAIARALLKNPNILVLDEATSALDAESEHLVQEALDRLLKGRTVITIAHRLSTIVNADNIAVLHQGNIIEIGNYDRLMGIENGFFRKLVERQMIGSDDT